MFKNIEQAIVSKGNFLMLFSDLGKVKKIPVLHFNWRAALVCSWRAWFFAKFGIALGAKEAIKPAMAFL
jgi:hypothetical protein